MTTVNSGREIRRLAIYLAVGGLNTAICYALFAALIHYGRWHYQAALVADYGFGIVLGYALHRGSTFADRAHLRRAFSKYTLTTALTFVANFALLDAIVRLAILEPLSGQAIAMATVTAVSYGAQKHWVFRSHGEQAETGDAPLQAQPHGADLAARAPTIARAVSRDAA
ncbi:MAG: GtrA family protein [Pirellulales bacterium]